MSVKEELLVPDEELVLSDFDIFCQYVLEKPVKLSPKTGYIGKKDCFELDRLFRVKENYEKPTRFQDRYPVIQFFYWVSLKYDILQLGASGTAMVQGIHYQLFKSAPAMDRYVFLALEFFSEFAILDQYRDFSRETTSFFSWAEEQKAQPGHIYRRAEWPIFWRTGSETAVHCLEELRVVRVWQEEKSGVTQEMFEILPMYPAAVKMHRVLKQKIRQIDDNEYWLKGCFQSCMEKACSRKESPLSAIYDPVTVECVDQIIDLEVTVRYQGSMRVIRMNLSDTLYTLHWMIQKAFDFDNDHLFEFFVGSGMMKKSYTIEEAMTNGDEYDADETTLGELMLHKGSKFTYLFDFGDQWWFDIKVRQILDGHADGPEIIERKGKAPEQYPNWEEEAYGWDVLIDENTAVQSILEDIQDEYIDGEYAALNFGTFGEESTEWKRQEMARLVQEKPDKMLLFLPEKAWEAFREMLSEEWIREDEMCWIARLASFGFCTFPKGDAVLVPENVAKIYRTKVKKSGSSAALTEAAAAVLYRCGVMETKELWKAAQALTNKKISYKDFEWMVFGRLCYFGSAEFHVIDGNSIVSRYGREITEEILDARQRPENTVYEYPDFERAELKELQEIPQAYRNWWDYLLNTSGEPEKLPELAEEIAWMAASGVYDRRAILKVYHEKIRDIGGKVTKKGERLIDALMDGIPLATRKGNGKD